MDLRCVRYDLSPRSLFEGKYAKEVVVHWRNLEAASWIASPIFVLGEAVCCGIGGWVSPRL